MRMRALLTGTFVVAVALMPSTPAQAYSRSSRPAYTWVLDATLIVAGRVESVGGDKGTLRITKTLAGRADAAAEVTALRDWRTS